MAEGGDPAGSQGLSGPKVPIIFLGQADYFAVLNPISGPLYMHFPNLGHDFFHQPLISIYRDTVNF